MTDIVERLRGHHRATGDWARSDSSIYTEAADEIERLTADNVRLQTELTRYRQVCCDQAGLDDEIERLRAALQHAADGLEEGGYTIEADMARRALENKP